MTCPVVGSESQIPKEPFEFNCAWCSMQSTKDKSFGCEAASSRHFCSKKCMDMWLVNGLGSRPKIETRTLPKRDTSFCLTTCEVTGKEIVAPLIDGREIAGVKACAVACNSDGTRTMTIELELE